MARIRAAAARHTRHGSRLPRGFAAADHRRLRQLADNQAHQLSRHLVNRAVAHGCQAAVFERLKGWRPRGGRQRTPMKQRFHRWFHRMLIQRVESKATEAGLRSRAVYPRGTSSQAYDGSGKVVRDKGNASQCTFVTGKRYNSDLNAAYNIGARGLAHYQQRRRKMAPRAGQQTSGRTPGSPVTLSSLWPQQA